MDETDDFYDFRSRVLELVRDVTPIVGATRCYTTMYSKIKAGGSWDQTEAVLFVMSAIGKYIDVSVFFSCIEIIKSLVFYLL